MLTDNQKNQLRSWARNIYELLCANPLDTTSDRIRQNREKLLPYVAEMKEYISQVLPLLPVNIKSKADTLVTLINDYYKYFAEGYRSPNSIDTLLDIIKTSLAEFIKYEEA